MTLGRVACQRYLWHHKLPPSPSPAPTPSLMWREWRDSRQSRGGCITLHPVMQTRKCFTTSKRSDICNRAKDGTMRRVEWDTANQTCRLATSSCRRGNATSGGATGVINVPSCGVQATAHCRHRNNNAYPVAVTPLSRTWCQRDDYAALAGGLWGDTNR